MRVFVAGGTGIVGRRIVRLLAERGHQVVASTTSADKLDLLAELGAQPVVMDGLSPESVEQAVQAARPDVVVNQMTALHRDHAGQPDYKHMDRWMAGTSRLRRTGNDNLLTAAAGSGVSTFIAQGYAGWNGESSGGWVKDEDRPLALHVGTAAQAQFEALRYLEEKVSSAGGAVLRFGALYGPGAVDDQIDLLRKRQYPLIGKGSGRCSWVHVDDAAAATVLATEQRAKGIFNIVDDEPAPASAWLPWLAECVGGKAPYRIPGWIARFVAGEAAVRMMTVGRGFTNAKAKSDLAWNLRFPSWRQGFETGLA